MKRKAFGHKQVKERRKEIAVLIAQLRLEDEELAVADKVLSRMAGDNSGEQLSLNTAIRTPRKALGKDGKTVGDYILQVLDEMSLIDSKGMTSPEILAKIQARWLPHLARTSFSPPLSRLCKSGKVLKSGDYYFLPVGVME